MSYLTSFLTAICASAVFIGALYMLCPDGSMSKPVTYILGLIFILSVISASGMTVKKADISLPQTEYTLADSDDNLIAAAEYVYSSVLEKSGINFSKITVCTNKTESGGISISKVQIVSKDDKEKILSALEQTAQTTEVEIIYE